jgi:hypothetical protein
MFVRSAIFYLFLPRARVCNGKHYAGSKVDVLGVEFQRFFECFNGFRDALDGLVMFAKSLVGADVGRVEPNRL